MTNKRTKREPRPYALSWINRLNTWVEQLSGPSWLYYLGLGLVLFLAQVIVLRVEGASLGVTLPMQGFIAGVIAFILALCHYLDARASTALETLRPALNTSEKEYDDLHYRLTTLPARSTVLLSLVAFLTPFLIESIGNEPYRLEALAPFPISANLFRLLYLICWGVFGTLFYHTVHQLRLINRIYTEHTRINLFRMMPLYAFASLTAFTAGSLTVIPYAFFYVNRISFMNDSGALVTVLVIQFLAIVAFVWPQLGIHRLQDAEHARLLDEINRRYETITTELHRRVDAGELQNIGDLNTAMSSLEMERQTLARISTWPWQPETVRWLVTALVLPLGLWLVQYFLQRVLGP
ncbi:MAG: hypothetical protein GY832_28265 [Chloroflexi bacterium]|nr:hypothetical protein [Chloroflexota bacterium]